MLETLRGQFMEGNAGKNGTSYSTVPRCVNSQCLRAKVPISIAISILFDVVLVQSWWVLWCVLAQSPRPVYDCFIFEGVDLVLKLGDRPSSLQQCGISEFEYLTVDALCWCRSLNIWHVCKRKQCWIVADIGLINTDKLDEFWIGIALIRNACHSYIHIRGWVGYTSTRSELVSFPFECFWRCAFYNNSIQKMNAFIFSTWECPMRWGAHRNLQFSPWVLLWNPIWIRQGRKQIGMARTGQRWGGWIKRTQCSVGR